MDGGWHNRETWWGHGGGAVPLVLKVRAAVCAVVCVAGLSSLPTGSTTVRAQATTEASSALVIEGADASGIKLTSATASFVYSLRVLSQSSAAINGVQIVIEPFVDPSGAQLQPSVSVAGAANNGEATIDVAPFGIVPITVSADLVAAGDYKSSLILTYSNTRNTVPLMVSRTNVAPSVAVDPISEVAADVGFGAIDLDVTANLRETGGRTVTLDQSGLTSLLIKDGTDEVQAPHGTVDIIDANNKPLSKTIILQPGEAKVVRLRLHELSDAGQYTGSMRFASTGAPPVDTSFTLLVRRAWWIAALLIALGVVISWFLTQYFTTWRKRLHAQQTIAALASRLDRIVVNRGPTEDQKREIDSLRAQIGAMYPSALAADGVDVTAQATVIDKKLDVLGQWLNTGPAVARDQAVMDYLESYSPSDDQVNRAQQALAPQAVAPATVAGGPSQLARQKEQRLGKRPLQRIQEVLDRYDSLADAALGAVAVLIGLQILWVPNLAWGGVNDYIIAVLWGLGLHQVGSTSFSGIAGLRSVFGGAGPPQNAPG